MTTRLQATDQKTVRPALLQELAIANPHAAPRLVKVVVNVGLGRALKDPAFAQTALSTLERITGQKPVATRAKQSIASFKLREGMVIGAKVTLRGARAEAFVDKLVRVTLPRVRDFRGVNPGAVVAGTLSIGLPEHNVFPEIRSDEIERLHGLEVTIVSSARDQRAGFAFFRALGFPFAAAAGEAAPKRRRVRSA